MTTGGQITTSSDQKGLSRRGGRSQTSMRVKRERLPSQTAGVASKKPEWAHWSDEQLLKLPMRELDLRIEGSILETRIEQLYRELEQRNIHFRPYFWLSDEWFTPDGVPGTAIPFYLAHPRLARLERSQMLEVEGGEHGWCMRILRHETGHAIDHAYRIYRRRRRQQLFGKSSQRYPDYYTPRPYSKRFVIHLEPSYAQSHPDEDFAESFAVWLFPRAGWRKRYTGWPALKKLKYVDEVMREIGKKKPLVSSHQRVDPLSRLRKTLGEHYREKRHRHGLDYPDFYVRDLRHLFSDAPEYKANMTAATFLTRIRGGVRRVVARWTGEYQYTIDQVLDDMTTSCRELGLRLVESEERTTLEFTILLTVHTMNYRHSGRHQVWL